MITSMRFSVLGEAKPKGSTRSFYNPKTKKVVTVGANPGTKDWQQRIATEAQKAVEFNGVFFPKEQAVNITMIFYLPRPACIKDREPDHTKRPDIDKLARSVLDGLTGIVYEDDSQVKRMNVEKAYARVDSPPRVEISIC